MFLHEAIQEVLKKNGNVPMRIEDIAAKINWQGLYGGGATTAFKVGYRAVGDVAKGIPPHAPPIFDVLIRLRK